MVDLSKANDRVMIEADLVTWMLVHGSLLLALRHPSHNGTAAQLTSDFAHHLLTMLVDQGFLSTEDANEVARVEIQETVQGNA